MIGIKAYKRSKYVLEAEEGGFLAARSYSMHMTQALVKRMLKQAVMQECNIKSLIREV